MKLGTGNYGGSKVKKTAVVHTNDPENPQFELTITGQVDRFVEINPKYVRLTGYAGETVSVPVTITPTAKYPFKITEVAARGGNNFKYTLTEKKSGQSGGYTLLIENTKRDKGRYMDLLTLTTDSQIQPKIIIRVYGNILERNQEQAPPKSSG